MLGGLDKNGFPIVVEIDESELVRLDQNGETAWVIGGIECSDKVNCFVALVRQRDDATLRKVISHHVEPNSIIRTEQWGRHQTDRGPAYRFRHHTINHSIRFAHEDGSNTNTVEGITTAPLKRWRIFLI